MSYEAAMTVIGNHLTTAGNSTTPKTTYVRRGEPITMPDTPMLAWYYDGERESSTGGNTMGGKTNIEAKVIIAGLYPIGDTGDHVSAALDAWTFATVRAITAALWADAELGGNTIGIDVEDPAPMWWSEGGFVRGFEIPVWLDLAEVDTIAR